MPYIKRREINKTVSELSEKDKCCFQCTLIDCIDTHPECLRKKFRKRKNKVKKHKKRKKVLNFNML